MDWIDSIKQFFQNMYNDAFSTIVGWYDSVSSFFSNAYDIILIVIVVGLAFLIFKLLKYLSVPAIILSEMLMLSITITAMLTFVALLATSLVSIYNRIFTVTDMLNTGFSGLDCVPYMFSCLGVDGVLSYYFTELFAILVVVLIIRISSLFLWAIGVVSEKIWRIGVLLGLV